MQKEAQGAKVLGISSGRLSGIEVCYPLCKKEQQRIVSCLSSFDDLINVQAQKIKALNAHKKALIQGLFPSAEEVNG